MNFVAYYIVAIIVRNALAVIKVMKFPLHVVEFAVFDEDPGIFWEHSFEGLMSSLSHLGSGCTLGIVFESESPKSSFISPKGLYMDYIRIH